MTTSGIFRLISSKKSINYITISDINNNYELLCNWNYIDNNCKLLIIINDYSDKSIFLIKKINKLIPKIFTLQNKFKKYKLKSKITFPNLYYPNIYRLNFKNNKYEYEISDQYRLTISCKKINLKLKEIYQYHLKQYQYHYNLYYINLKQLQKFINEFTIKNILINKLDLPYEIISIIQKYFS